MLNLFLWANQVAALILYIDWLLLFLSYDLWTSHHLLQPPKFSNIYTLEGLIIVIRREILSSEDGD